MKNIVAIFLCISIMVCAGGCNNKNVLQIKEVQTETSGIPKTIRLARGEMIITENYPGINDWLARVRCPIIFTANEDKDKYPGLSKAFNEKYNSLRSEGDKEIEENKKSFLKGYKSPEEYIGTEMDCYKFRYSMTNHNAFVRRADTKVTSILYSRFAFISGAAHGHRYHCGENYDTQTGKKLSLDDVVTDKKALAKAVSEQLNIYYAGINGTEREFDIQNIEQYAWTIDYNGITFHFSSYELGPYAAGTPTVTVSNVEYPDIVKKEYQLSPEGFGIELKNWHPLYFDIDGDGKLNNIKFSFDESSLLETSNYEGIEIFIDKEYVTDECFEDDETSSEEPRATFVHTGGGRNYIYVEYADYNKMIKVVRYEILGDGSVKKMDETNTGGYKLFSNEEEHILVRDVITNPIDVFFSEN